MTCNVTDLLGVIHVSVDQEARTRCGREFTVSQQYAKAWPSNVIVEHMDRVAAAPTCVRCLGSP